MNRRAVLMAIPVVALVLVVSSAWAQTRSVSLRAGDLVVERIELQRVSVPDGGVELELTACGRWTSTTGDELGTERVCRSATTTRAAALAQAGDVLDIGRRLLLREARLLADAGL